MFDIKGIIRRFGETLREIGLLIMVFAPLDALFAERNVNSDLITGIFIAGAVVVVCGILISELR